MNGRTVKKKKIIKLKRPTKKKKKNQQPNFWYMAKIIKQ